MTTVNKVEKTTGRNFYAMKDRNGKLEAYAFPKIAERNTWLERHEGSKAVTAFEVYQLMNKAAHEALIVNRRNRVMKIGAEEEIFPEKGQRFIR